MSRDMSAFGIPAINSSRTTQSEGNENEFEIPVNSIPLRPPRTPLNTIPDPSQNPKETQEHDLGSRAKLDTGRLIRLPDRKTEAFDHLPPLNKGNGNINPGSNCATPRGAARGKSHSEPNSAQSTLARSVSKVSNGGAALGGSTSNRTLQYNGLKGCISSRVSRGISIVPSMPLMEVPHFELVEDPSFWMDHNVQVLIRIRPLSTSERTLQGYGRCLRQESAQTLTWLGHPETRFTFDHIACETISQEKLFKAAGLPMVENCMSGYNSCMFAYGQTGSGKTYTMMGEIYEMDNKLNEDCGITPRIFEYLFMRIRAEEERRKNENLKYSCKCSFLEIYNEQVTDLLEPSSTNLQLREDMKKGVYVENLTEYEVTTVNDVIKLLLKGATNRKMAATQMNSESSRSHSVFTCVIKSRWDKDSMTHTRFGRLNLVDLAGSERQKSSGAEGERLKEAANINKSLSTLGLVIMTLVDVAHGKHRHIPYRDSRLTFLLQDSLGGNSKTTIIANVSPSICSASETLSTLKFAQRAKLIQNNAKVNEDASGDVTTLQREIQQLKDQLNFLLRNQDLSRSLSCCFPTFEQPNLSDCDEEHKSFLRGRIPDNKDNASMPPEKRKCMEATIVGSLRREKMAEDAVRMLEAEIEHMKRLVHQRDEDAECTKMMLKFREDKIKRLELLADGLVSGDEYLMEENSALAEEIQLLQGRIDRNPELTRFALENIRLVNQLRMFQDFYEQGEREKLLNEISELRKQLLETLEGNYEPQDFPSRKNVQENDTLKELEDCRRNLRACLDINAGLTREVNELQKELQKYLSCGKAAFHSNTDSSFGDDATIKQTDYSLVEIISNKFDCEDEVAYYNQGKNEIIQKQNDHKICDLSELPDSDNQKELKDAKFLIEAMESERVHLVEELDILRQENCKYAKLLRFRNSKHMQSTLELDTHCEPLEGYHGDISILALQAKFDRMHRDLEQARVLNRQYQDDQASQLSHLCEVELVREQVEVETARTILHLQEEISTLQQELQDRVSFMTQENTRLRNIIASKEEEIRSLSDEWEKAILDLTSFLIDGCKSLEDASNQIEKISVSFPQGIICISEHVERAASILIEKERTIMQLQKSLEEAQKMGLEMSSKLSSLKGATVAITEVHRLENVEISKEVLQLRTLLNENISVIQQLESKLKEKEDEVEAMKCAGSASIEVKRSSGFLDGIQKEDNKKEYDELVKINPNRLDEQIKHPEIEDEYPEIEQIKYELGQANARLNAIKSGIRMLFNMCGFSETVGELVWSNILSVDSFATDSDLSPTDIAPKDEMQKSSPSNFDSVYLGELREHYWDSPSERDLTCVLGDRLDTYQNPIRNLFCNNVTILSLKQEVQLAINSLQEIYLQLGSLSDLDGKTNGSLLEGRCVLESPAFGKSAGELEMEEAKEGCDHTREIFRFKLHDAKLVADEKIKMTGSFLSKLEEAQATMEEADAMLNALLKANENEKHVTNKWKQANEKLMMERAILIDEVKQLKTSIHLKEGEYKFLQDQMHSDFAELASSISSLEESFLLMQRDADERFGMVYSDIFSLGKYILDCIYNSRSTQEDVWSLIMEKDISLFVMNQCYLGKYMEKLSGLNMEVDFLQQIHKECHSVLHNPGREWLITEEGMSATKGIFHMKCIGEKDKYAHPEKKLSSPGDIVDIGMSSAVVAKPKEQELSLSYDNLIAENLLLKSELARKDVLLKGLFFDLSLLQESTSNAKDTKAETEHMFASLSQVQHELSSKTSQLNYILVQHEELTARLVDCEAALSISNHELEQAKYDLDMMSNQNAELRDLIEDLHLKRNDAEVQLEEKNDVVKGLEKEILRMASSVDQMVISAIENTEDELRKVISERDCLHKEVVSLNEKFEMANALAEENEAIAIEARQVSEANKIYAEQKEEEVKILERSVEELESTINVLEKKVYEMGEEVERHRSLRDELELEVQALRQRVSTVETAKENMEYSNDENETEDQMSRHVDKNILELHEAKNRIRVLEKERADQAEELKRCRMYTSELVLHSEAQASQYQQKYKMLEAKVRELKTAPSTFSSAASTLEKIEKGSARTRGSSSPFRCIASLVQQMNLEKDQELSVAKLRIEELEALAASRQKEVCMLNTRLAATENMTHDVIRDLLGVKLDITNYANLIDQHQVQKLLEEAHRQTEQSLAKEILKLKKWIDDLVEERKSCIDEINQRESDILAAQVTIEQVRQREQLLTAQNEMLKTEKINLKRKIVELDEMIKKLVGSQNIQQLNEQLGKESNFRRVDNKELSKRLAHSEKFLSRVNERPNWYAKSDYRGLCNKNEE
ncbi:PREDICTED: kinesin-like protein KIN-12C isoform X2 [Nelumbo nucifera]|uniref:Kinesin-like protein KIN-12C isoform X2 n=1 Tax=Nelumbo nucifera TaxID=4432 RepID=A0A1U8BA07_NELNU|nr:PREDICTED: kinesin-like protein KIN-12C isoform X2 [Nelumbo nucifera]